MTLTKSEARAAVMKKARAYIGYNPGRTYSLFGAWYGWENALWCAAGSSKPFYEALGYDLAIKVIGFQADGPNQRGWIWTVKFRQWLQANGTKITLKDVQEGDILFFKYPTDDPRNENPVNHVDIVNGNEYSRGYIPTLGPNTPRPGTPGDPSNGRGFWRHNRSIADPFIVDAYRPNWDAVSESEDELSDAQFNELKKMIETVDRKVDSSRGEALTFHKRETANLKVVVENQNSILSAFSNIGSLVWNYRIPFFKGTKAFEIFGKDFRAGGLLSYPAIQGYTNDANEKLAKQMVEEIKKVNPRTPSAKPLQAVEEVPEDE